MKFSMAFFLVIILVIIENSANAAVPENTKVQCKTIEYVSRGGKETRNSQVVEAFFSANGLLHTEFPSKIHDSILFSVAAINGSDGGLNASIKLGDGLTSTSSISLDKVGDYAVVEVAKSNGDVSSPNFTDGFQFAMVCRLVPSN